MPIYIVRDDITNMHCDAIVNATNSQLFPDGGVDLAVHKAAGKELFDMCKTLGGVDVGRAKITPAYRLPCRFIIHTVGPWWQGGTHREKELLQSCYQECLHIAKAAKCQSLAFPLISSGVHGYPKDDVLKEALAVIKDFLNENDMSVYVVLYGKDEYALKRDVEQSVSEYLVRNYEAEKTAQTEEKERNTSEDDGSDLIFAESISRRHATPFVSRARRSAPRGFLQLDSVFDDAPMRIENERLESADRLGKYARYEEDFDVDLTSCKGIFDDMYDGFALTLMKLIDDKGISDVACYKKANVSRQTWHKILNDAHYKPNKKTILSFAIALELDVDQTQKLLATAGFVLSKSSKFDVIIMYCIDKKIYDVLEIDAILFQYDQETLASKQ